MTDTLPDSTLPDSALPAPDGPDPVPAAGPREVRIPSGADHLHAWHFAGAGDAFAGPAGRPCVVMAHGLGGTKDSGLEPFARALAEAGLDVLAFDYRGFGRSGGEPRQVVSPAGQLADYRAAMGAAARLEGVDAGRLVLWGVSLAGGLVLEAAAGRDDVAAVIAVVPLVDGRAAAVQAARQHPTGQLVRSGARGVRARVGELLGRAPDLVPLAGPPGSAAVLSLPGAEEAYLRIAGPSWRNEVGASIATQLGSFRPVKRAGEVTAPVLVQIADLDRSAPPQAAAKAAFKARAEVRHYPCDHFDLFEGTRWHQPAVRHQLHFLRRRLG